MNNQSPLVPQGSLLEQKNKGRARLRIVVFFILAVHGIGLLALLMQGCKQDKGATDATEASNTNPAPALEATNPVVVTNAVSSSATTAVASPIPATPIPPPTAPAVPQDYTIGHGDTFSALAKKFGVSTKALEEANPGVEPTKLQVGQKIHVPAPATTVASATTSTAATTDTAEGEQMYVVKSGDTLSSIGRQFGVRIRAIRSANSLTTDRIIVGQKLKIPAKTAASTTLATNPPDVNSANPSAASTNPTR